MMELSANYTNATLNSTLNTSEIVPTSGSLNSIYADETRVSQVFRIVLYSLIFVFTLVGNSLVIAIVIKSKELRTGFTTYKRNSFSVSSTSEPRLASPVTGYLIANLAVADLSVAVLCIPFTIIYYELNHWPFGYAMCKILPTAQGMSVMASIGTITAISLDRFRSIVYPYEPRISTSQVKYILLAVWLMAAVVGFPMLLVMEAQQEGENIVCIEQGWPSKNYRKAYSVVTFVMTYAIPLPLVSSWYVIIVLKLREAARKTNDNEGFKVARAKGKVVRMLIIVVVCYFLCFLPFQVTWLWCEFGNGEEFSYIWVMLSWSQVVMYSNSAVNPILYSFLSTQFRRGLKRVLCCCKVSGQFCSVTSSRSGRLLSSTRSSFYDRKKKIWVSQTNV